MAKPTNLRWRGDGLYADLILDKCEMDLLGTDQPLQLDVLIYRASPVELTPLPPPSVPAHPAAHLKRAARGHRRLT